MIQLVISVKLYHPKRKKESTCREFTVSWFFFVLFSTQGGFITRKLERSKYSVNVDAAQIRAITRIIISFTF